VSTTTRGIYTRADVCIATRISIWATTAPLPLSMSQKQVMPLLLLFSRTTIQVSLTQKNPPQNKTKQNKSKSECRLRLCWSGYVHTGPWAYPYWAQITISSRDSRICCPSARNNFSSCLLQTMYIPDFYTPHSKEYSMVILFMQRLGLAFRCWWSIYVYGYKLKWLRISSASD